MSLLTKSTLFNLLIPLVSAGPSGFGHAFSSGPTADGNWIRTANSTLVVPSPPLPQKGLLSLWVGMGTSNGDLIQALVESYNDAIDDGCGVLNGDWCAWTSTLVSAGQQGGRQILANVGDKVQMSCPHRLPFLNVCIEDECADSDAQDMYNDDTGNYDQYVLINGVVVSTFSTCKMQSLSRSHLLTTY